MQPFVLKSKVSKITAEFCMRYPGLMKVPRYASVHLCMRFVRFGWFFSRTYPTIRVDNCRSDLVLLYLVSHDTFLASIANNLISIIELSE